MKYRFEHSVQIPGFPACFNAGEEVDEKEIHSVYLAGWIKAGIVVPVESAAPVLDIKDSASLDIKSSAPAEPPIADPEIKKA